MSSSRLNPNEASASHGNHGDEITIVREERAPGGNWIHPDDHLTGLAPTKSTEKTLRDLTNDFSFFNGIPFLIPSSRQRPWDCPQGYVCLYESLFRKCHVWLPLPKMVIAYCSRRKIAISQLTAASIKHMIALMTLGHEFGIEIGVEFLENMSSINQVTQKKTKLNTGFVYINVKTQYKLIDTKPDTKIYDWKGRYFFLKVTPESVGDIDRIVKRKWADTFGRYHLGNAEL